MFIPGSLLTAALMPFIGAAMQRGTSSKMLIFVGLAGIEVCLYMMTLFSPLTSYGEIIRMLFVRGFAMAFLFVPINSSILSQFTGINLGQVSGLLNLFRQIGGSAGIALIGTLLAKNSHQNYLDIANNVTLLNPNTQSNYQQMVGSIAAKMSSEVGMGTATQAATKILDAKVQNQAFMLSFNQMVFYIMIIFALTFIPLYMLKLKRITGKVSLDAH
jgi:DHA2 family multidrug resistance protein